MSLKIEVEEIKLLPDGNYRAVVRANRYENKPRSSEIGGDSLTWTESVKTEIVAEFSMSVSRKERRKRKTQRRIEDIESAAKSAVLELCR